MPINGAAWARVGARIHAYLIGEEPDSLVPAIGDPVLFVHDKTETEATPTEAGLVTAATLVAYTRERLTVGAIYTYGGSTWQVAMSRYDRAAGGNWPNRNELARHAE